MLVKDKIRVGILRGGEGEHYNSSLKKGGDFISYLNENLSGQYKPIDILVDKDGVWHLRGMPVEPSKLLYKVDVVWNLADPRFSNILHSFSIPSIGVPPFSQVLGKSREMLREHMRKMGVEMPRSLLLPVYQSDFDGPRERYAIKKAKEVFEKFGSPWIVKSFTPDTNMGIHLAKTFGELAGAIEDGVKHEKSILVEEFIAGKVAPVHTVQDFRGADIYVFPPGQFTNEEKEKLISIARNLHSHVGAGQYLRSDFVLNPRGKVYLISLETAPDLKKESHFDQACESVGAKMHHVIEHILQNSLS